VRYGRHISEHAVLVGGGGGVEGLIGGHITCVVQQR
jgi:hypothetical protein